jgi:hypothetical protein
MACCKPRKVMKPLAGFRLEKCQFYLPRVRLVAPPSELVRFYNSADGLFVLLLQNSK